jgi:hypothetical protein
VNGDKFIEIFDNPGLCMRFLLNGHLDARCVGAGSGFTEALAAHALEIPANAWILIEFPTISLQPRIHERQDFLRTYELTEGTH